VCVCVCVCTMCVCVCMMCVRACVHVCTHTYIALKHWDTMPYTMVV